MTEGPRQPGCNPIMCVRACANQICRRVHPGGEPQEPVSIAQHSSLSRLRRVASVLFSVDECWLAEQFLRCTGLVQTSDLMHGIECVHGALLRAVAFDCKADQ